MPAQQQDLFGTPSSPSQGPDPETVAIVRARLHATLALVQSAKEMPWTDMLSIIREDNAFRYNRKFLPDDEGDALWAAFDVEMDRLYAIMNQGMDHDPSDSGNLASTQPTSDHP